MLRILTGVVNSLYDPMGIICPITIGLKILMKDTHKLPDLKWAMVINGNLALQSSQRIQWIPLKFKRD